MGSSKGWILALVVALACGCAPKDVDDKSGKVAAGDMPPTASLEGHMKLSPEALAPLDKKSSGTSPGADSTGSGDPPEPASAPSQKSDADPVQPLRDEIKALGSNDMTAFMATVDPDSTMYASTKQFMETLRKSYRVTVTLDSSTVKSNDHHKAVVEFTQDTKKVSGPAFRDNTSTSRAWLHVKNGHWMLYASKVMGVKYLN